jgi:hypothetical protein
LEEAEPMTIARASMYMALADYKRAFKQLVRLALRTGAPSYKIDKDPGNYYASILMLLRNHHPYQCLDAMLALHELLYEGNDEFSGLEGSHRVYLPTWFWDQLRPLLPLVFRSADWRFAPVLEKARLTSSNFIPVFRDAIKQLNVSEALALVEALLTDSCLSTEPLEVCAAHIITIDADR